MFHPKQLIFGMHFLALIALSGCTFSRSYDQNHKPIQSLLDEEKRTIDGKWISKNQRTYSLFTQGNFSTIAINTQEKIAVGSYTIKSNKVSIKGVSLIRKTPIKFECIIIEEKDLTCTSITGERLLLKRLEENNM